MIRIVIISRLVFPSYPSPLLMDLQLSTACPHAHASLVPCLALHQSLPLDPAEFPPVSLPSESFQPWLQSTRQVTDHGAALGPFFQAILFSPSPHPMAGEDQVLRDYKRGDHQDMCGFYKDVLFGL